MSLRSRVLLSRKLLVLVHDHKDLSILVNRNINFIEHRRGEVLPTSKAASFRVVSNSSVPSQYLDGFDVVVRLAKSPAPGRYTVEVVHQARRLASIPDFIITRTTEYPMTTENLAAKPKAARKPVSKIATAAKAVVKEFLTPATVIVGNVKIKKAVDDLIAIGGVKGDSEEHKVKARAAVKEMERPGAVICSTPAFRKAVADLAEASA